MNFNIKYTKISIIINSKPPYFIGSQLRGALGYALKKITCINPSYKCDNCFASNDCLYYKFYEEKNSFHNYRFDFKLDQDYYNFDFYLFNEMTTKLPYIISAFNILFTQIGLDKGKDKIFYKDFDIYINDKKALINGEFQIPQDTIIDFNPPQQTHKDIKIKLITPLRIKKNNRFIRDDSIELFDIINSIQQRGLAILSKDREKLNFDITGDIIIKNLRYKELTRKSNRQKTKMNLGGIIGEIVVKGVDKDSYRLLKLGELIGVGKSTVFGLGKMEVKSL